MATPPDFTKVLGPDVSSAGTKVNRQKQWDFSGDGVSVVSDDQQGIVFVSIPGGSSGSSGATAWQTYEPTIVSDNADSDLPGDGGAISGLWRQTGPDTIDVRVDMYVGSTADFGTGPLTISIPSGLSIDNTKTFNDYYLEGGDALYRDSSTPANDKRGCLRTIGTDSVTPSTPGSGDVSATSPFTWSTNDVLLVWVTLPVIGL